ncbi:hypothetical protein D3C76_313200 [compost metagenome]
MLERMLRLVSETISLVMINRLLAFNIERRLKMSSDNKQAETKSKSTEKGTFSKIFENYNFMNQMMANELKLASEHSGLTGNFREEMWLKFFRSIVPMKYSLAQGVMIIDSEGNVSKEVDIAVYDEQYTPYVFQYNTLKFIPIEAVVIVIECKSKNYEREALRVWVNSIETLKPRPTGIARTVQGYAVGFTNNSQTSTRPIRILASLKKFVDISTMEKLSEELKDLFDFVIMDNGNTSGFEVTLINKEKSLQWWGDTLNKSTKKSTAPESSQNMEKSGGNEKYLEDQGGLQILHLPDNVTDEELQKRYSELSFSEKSMTKTLKDLEVEENPLLTLNLQLNQLLMLINNPMMFPHFAYANAFNKGVTAKD